ncbi:WD40 repeat domain-containing protein [Candidatus Albibeggiatoa sp. nov. NOAA]|uniref:WD40 repeat domain-containing protein n=1 Tax=Candidatus Albibeggiatoa sp. nov. NOAA TaxID=3162724 RepID=UPI0032F2B22B|nr:WD40 repeat domain-containing protein [Thiotrichaceae bacterium]
MSYKNTLLLLLCSSLSSNALADIRYEGLSTRCLVKTQAENFMYAGIQISGGEKEVEISTQAVSQITNNQFIPQIEVKTFPEAVSVYRDDNPKLSTELQTTLTLTEGFYTITVSPATAAEGIAIINAYETGETEQALDSISTRCYIGDKDEHAMIAGIQVRGNSPRADFRAYQISEIPNNPFLPRLQLQTFPDGQFFNEVKSVYQHANTGYGGDLKLLHRIQDLQQGLYTATVQPSNQAGIGIINVAKPEAITPIDNIYVNYQNVTQSPSTAASVQVLALSEDNRIMVVGFDNRTIQVWDTKTGKKLQTLVADEDLGTFYPDVHFMPTHSNGRLILTSTFSGDVRIWDRKTDDRKQLSLPGKIVSSVSDSVVNPNGQQIALTDYHNNVIQVWNISTDRLIQTIRIEPEAKTKTINQASFDPTGQFFTATTSSNKLYIWNTADFSTAQTFENVKDFAFDPTGKWLATASYNDKAQVWNTTTFNTIYTLSLSHLEHVSFHPNKNFLLTVADEAVIRELQTGQPIAKLTGYGTYNTQFQFHPEGQFILASAEKYRPIWNLATVNNLTSVPSIPLEIAPIQTYLLNEQYTFSSDWAFTLKRVAEENGVRIDFKPLSDLIVEQPQVEIQRATSITPKTALSVETVQSQRIANQTTVSSFAISPDRHTIAINSAQDSSISLWDVSTNTEVGRLNNLTSNTVPLSFSPDGRTLAFGTWGKAIQLLDVTTGKLLFKLEGHAGWPESITFNPDSNILFVTSGRHIYLWNTTTGKLESTLIHTHPVTAIAYDPNENTLASGSGSEKSTVQLWNVATGQSISTFETTNNIHALAFHPNGKTLAINNDKLGIMLLDVTTMKSELLTQPIVGINYQKSLEFSSDGNMLLSGKRLWDIATKTVTADLNTSSILNFHTKFTSDKHFVALSHSNATGIELLNISELYQLKYPAVQHTIAGNKGGTRAIAFSPDETLLATASNIYQDKIHIWDTKTGQKRYDLGELVQDSHLDGCYTESGHIVTLGLSFACNQQLSPYWVNSLNFNTDGSILTAIMNSNPSSTRSFNISTGEQVTVNDTGAEEVITHNLTVSEAYDGRVIQLKDATTGELQHSLATRVQDNFIDSESFKLSPSGQFLTFKTGEGVQLFDISEFLE